jgi:hypothetical protein
MKWSLERMKAVEWLLEHGSWILISAGKRVTNVAALEAGYFDALRLGALPGWSRADCREAARRDAKRLPEINERLRKIEKIG